MNCVRPRNASFFTAYDFGVFPYSPRTPSRALSSARNYKLGTLRTLSITISDESSNNKSYSAIGEAVRVVPPVRKPSQEPKWQTQWSASQPPSNASRKQPKPSPEVEAARNRIHRLHARPLIFGFYACRICTRWFPSDRAEDANEPTECPLHDDVARLKAERGKESGKRLAGWRVR